MSFPRSLQKLREDGKERCSETVPTPGTRMSYHQCTRVAVEDGKCSLHCVSGRRARSEKLHAKWAAERADDNARKMKTYGKPLIEALRSIARGHDNPTTFARKVLEENGIALDEPA